MKKKLLFTSLAAAALLALGACSSGGSMDEDIVTMKGGSVTAGDYYNQIKTGSSNVSMLQQTVIYKVFENAYGDDVSDDAVQERYDEVAKGYTDQGQDFAAALEQYGFTEKTYKENLRQYLAFQAGLEANVELTDEDLEAAWETYHPEVETQIIQVADEETANDLHTQLDEGADFGELAEANSTSDEVDFKFDSTSTEIPAEVQDAAFALEDGAYSAVIPITNASTYTTSYYIVRMVKNADKGDDMSEYEDKIKEIATTAKTSDDTFVTETISKELKDANVQIKDDDFADLLAGYLSTTDSSSSDSSTADSSTADSSTADSSSSSTEDSE